MHVPGRYHVSWIAYLYCWLKKNDFKCNNYENIILWYTCIKSPNDCIFWAGSKYIVVRLAECRWGGAVRLAECRYANAQCVALTTFCRLHCVALVAFCRARDDVVFLSFRYAARNISTYIILRCCGPCSWVSIRIWRSLIILLYSKRILIFSLLIALGIFVMQ